MYYMYFTLCHGTCSKPYPGVEKSAGWNGILAASSACRTYRAPVPHRARTRTKSPGVLTHVPTQTYTQASPSDRAVMRAMLGEELKDLEKQSDERKKRKKKDTVDDDMSIEKKAVLRTGTGTAGSSNESARFNTRGQKIPEDSPTDLLTGDRDGSEHAKVLVSPISYGRTRHKAWTSSCPI
jgi:hypothetical protein